MSSYLIGLLGILVALALLIFLAFRGFTLLLAAPAAAIVAAVFSREPILADLTITFMRATANFMGNFFPLFLSAVCLVNSWPTAALRFRSRKALSSG